MHTRIEGIGYGSNFNGTRCANFCYADKRIKQYRVTRASERRLMRLVASGILADWHSKKVIMGTNFFNPYHWDWIVTL